MKKYYKSDIYKLLGVSKETTRGRFIRPNAEEKWGVKREVVEVVRSYVPEDKIHLWIEDVEKENERRKEKKNAQKKR